MVEKDDLSVPENQPATTDGDIDPSTETSSVSAENSRLAATTDGDATGLAEAGHDDGLKSVAGSGSPSLKPGAAASEPLRSGIDRSVLKSDKPLFYACIAVVAIMTARLVYSVILHPLRIGWDPALHLQAAQLITQGKVPYVDMFDVNPPLIWYLDTIPAYLSELLNFPVTQSFNFFLVAIILYSVCTCLALFFSKAKSAEAPFFMPFLIGLTLFNFFLRYDFGQREEIFVLLYMPFFILRWLRWQGRGVQSKFYSCLIGIMGSLGICLKPFFLIPAALVELYFLLDKRKFSPLLTYETISCAAVGVIYAAHFLFVPELMRKTYFEFVIPAFALGYRFWDTSLAASFSEPAKRDVFFLMAASGILAVAMRKRSTLMLPLLVFVLASLIPYLLQFKGWHYHDQPVYAASFILACLQVGFLLYLAAQKVFRVVTGYGENNGVQAKFPKRAVLSCVVVLALGIAIKDGMDDYQIVVSDPRQFDMKIIGYSGTSPQSDIHSPYTDLVLDGYKLGDKAIVMSNAVSPGYPWLTQLRFVPGSRHLHMVILSVLSYVKDILPKTDSNVKLYSNMDRIVDEYAQDIEKNKPRFVFMQKGPDYFVEPHDFVNKYLIKDYDELENIENFRTFRRKPGR